VIETLDGFYCHNVVVGLWADAVANRLEGMALYLLGDELREVADHAHGAARRLADRVGDLGGAITADPRPLIDRAPGEGEFTIPDCSDPRAIVTYAVRRLNIIISAYQAFLEGPALLRGENMTTEPPWPWPQTMDALVAAPASHRVLLENDRVRVLEVVIEPRTREPEHTHQAASVMIVDEPARIRYYQGDALQYESQARFESPPGVRVRWMEPEGPHSVQNIDERRYHAIRVELK